MISVVEHLGKMHKGIFECVNPLSKRIIACSKSKSLWAEHTAESKVSAISKNQMLRTGAF